MFVSAPDWDTLLDVFSTDPLPDVVVPDAEERTSSYGPYRSPPSSRALQLDLEAPVRCPTCEGDMERLAFAAISRVIIDVCPEHGVWLDAGELEGIIDSVHPHPVPEPIVHEPVRHTPHLGTPRTLVEAAREPVIVPTTPEEAAYVPPSANWKDALPSPAPPVREAWTAQLGRALGRLFRMITAQKKTR